MRWSNCYIAGEQHPGGYRARSPRSSRRRVCGGPHRPLPEARQQITRAMTAAWVADAGAAEAIVVAGGQNDPRETAPLELSQRTLPTGETVADVGGELDIATADVAVRYVSQLIDGHRGPVIVNLAALRFCDAQGLHALVRMATCAERAGRPFRLASPSPLLVKIMRMTGLDRRFLAAAAGGPPGS